MTMSDLAGTTKETAQAWLADRASQYAAALSFYTLLALAPLLLIVVAIAGLAYGPGAARDHLISQIHDKAGAPVADATSTILTSAHRPGTGVAALLIGGALALFGASGAFSMMRTALNAMWHVPSPQTKRLLTKVRLLLVTRALNAALVIGFGICLVALLGLSAAWTWVAGRIGGALPAADLILRAADFVVTLGLLVLLFGALFRFTANVRPDWADLWSGALVTALLFNVGRLAIGLYLARGTVTSSFGGAGSVVALLLFMYYSAMILFFGAEFVQVRLRHRGRRFLPQDAVPAGEKPSLRAPARARRKGSHEGADDCP
jgi:membrane protein